MREESHTSARSRRSRPGPKRADGAPAGPDEVRRALLDAAEALFGELGVENVSLRDVAGAADVQTTLIWRYIGNRDDLIEQVFRRLTAALVADLEARPLQSMGFERDSVMGRWTVVLAYYASRGAAAPTVHPNPVDAIAATIVEAYGLDPLAARVRAAQVVGSALGWRMFESYLVDAADLGDLPLGELRADLTATHRRTGASPWPTDDPPLHTQTEE